ncbi:MAG TPA: HoxN/HupN/NixA family nickel/cobalt transporter [Gemmatimonadales bacterium]|nr:HoxN/HupN/NixA family nickel/cobalt transporter [Gemmatimonadales bacterium]
MLRFLSRFFHDDVAFARGRTVALYAVLAAANAGAWLWAVTAFRAYPLLLGTALLAYSLGLRHAIDADHIAAIDNVTRTLMQEGKRPVAVGFFFSLGHSTVVVLAAVAIAATASALSTRLASFRTVGGVVGTSASAAFLLLIAVMNLFILVSLYRTFHGVRTGRRYEPESLEELLAAGGPLARVLRPLFRMIRRSWHMYPLGLLFGLGFDTATEIGLLAISAAEAAKGMPIWSILVFPALFTAGMSLVDTTDSVLMVGAYGWAFTRPIRKLYYNLTITSISVLVALLVGGVEALALLADRLHLSGGLWSVAVALNGDIGSFGYLIVAVFVACWLVSAAIYRLKGYDALELAEPAALGDAEPR